MMSAGRDDDARGLVEAEIVERQADADEFGDDRQRVEQEQVDDAEGAPELAEPLEDQPRMADAGDRAEAQHHLLVDVEHRDQQRQRPQQRRAVVLAGLAVGREGAGVVVADHDDEAGAEDREQRGETVLPGVARARRRRAGWCRRRRGCGRYGRRRARRPRPDRRSGHSSSWVRSFRRRRLEEQTRRGSVGEGRRRSGGGFFVRLQGTRRMRQSRSNGASRAVVQVGLLFLPRTVESALGRADRAALKLRRPAPTVVRSSHSAVALKIDHDQPRQSTNAIAPPVDPPSRIRQPQKCLEGFRSSSAATAFYRCGNMENCAWFLVLFQAGSSPPPQARR